MAEVAARSGHAADPGCCYKHGLSFGLLRGSIGGVAGEDRRIEGSIGEVLKRGDCVGGAPMIWTTLFGWHRANSNFRKPCPTSLPDSCLRLQAPARFPTISKLTKVTSRNAAAASTHPLTLSPPARKLSYTGVRTHILQKTVSFFFHMLGKMALRPDIAHFSELCASVHTPLGL